MACNGDLDLPLIDLSELPLHWEQGHRDLGPLCRKIKAACEDLGFFYVINHGIHQNLVHSVDSAVRDLFRLPGEVKERAFSSNYFPAKMNHLSDESAPEMMAFHGLQLPDTVQDVSDKLWPQGNPTFCKAIKEYYLQLRFLANTIIKLILCSLNLDMSKHYASTFAECDGYLLMNQYPPLEKSISFQAHTDTKCITILYQDHVGGLQVRTKEGKWINVKPLPRAFILNLGDPLMMWSNGRYRSAQHRVVFGGEPRNRLSLAYFWYFPDEMEIWAPEELVDDEHPRKYKPFLYKDFKVYIQRVGFSLKPPKEYLL